MPLLRSLRVLIALTTVLLVTSKAVAQDAKPRPGLDAVFQAFDKYSVVLLGEVHWNTQQHVFIQTLLHDQRLPAAVNDIALECGNSLYQPLIDRYVAGDNVPADSLPLIWRNTTQVLAWDRSIYADLYRAIRDANKKLPAGKRMRVVALDPPIEWKSMQTAEQFPRIWGHRDPVWFETLDRDVLSKGRKVLVISGGLHILRRDPPDFQPRTFDRVGLGDALAQRYPNNVYRIYPAVGNNALTKLTQSWPAGSLSDILHTTIGARSAQVLYPSTVTMFRRVNGKSEPFTLKESDFPSVESVVDAILYYGPDTTSAPLGNEAYRNCDYVRELRRRNQFLLPIFGQDQSTLIDSLATAAAKDVSGKGKGARCER